MKKYICDVCGKEFGRNVPNVFSSTIGQSCFYATIKQDFDICTDCFNKIHEAQENAINDIKSKRNN